MPASLPRILVVDDDSNVLAFIERALLHTPCEVVTTASPEEALILMSRQQFEIVISDIRMPGINGYVIGRAAQKFGGMKGIILMTGNNVLDIYQDAKKAGADLVLQKPIRLDKVREVVEFYLAKPPSVRIFQQADG